MALEVQLGGARITRKVTPVPSAPILNGGCRKTRCFRVNHYTRYICSQSLQMHHEGWGSHLGEHTARGTMVPSRSKLHFYYLELRWSFGPLRIPRPLVEQYCCYIYRQDNSGCLYEGRRGMKSGPLCALLWRILTWFSRKQVTSPTHSRRLNVIAHKLSSVTQLNRADKMVPPVSFPNNMLLVAPRLSGPVCCHLAQQLSQLSSLVVDPPIWTMIQSVCHGRIWTHMPSHW